MGMIPIEDSVTCANNIKLIAKYRHCRIADVEKAMGVSKGFLSRVRKGQGVLHLEEVELAAATLNTAVSVLQMGGLNPIIETFNLIISSPMWKEKVMTDLHDEKDHFARVIANLRIIEGNLSDSNEYDERELFEQWLGLLASTLTYLKGNLEKRFSPGAQHDIHEHELLKR